jgi:hypothetical protein
VPASFYYSWVSRHPKTVPGICSGGS